MLFSSFPYLLLFLPLTVLGYALLRQYAGARTSAAWILCASLFFYGYYRPQHLPLLAGSVVFNWAIARVIASHPGKPLWIRIGLAANIGLLCSFKYFNFFLHGIASLGGPALALTDWEFPLGISFFTLTQVMYLVDVYQGAAKPVGLLDHATFVSLFPYVTSGPLVRGNVILNQFHSVKTKEPRGDMACRGLYLFAIGLTKKLLFADQFAAIANAGFNEVRDYSTLEAWVFCLAYAMQMYFDFSGYSDMAAGSAWMIGIEIPQNFNVPFRAKSVSEFWQRWHMSLSSFITNYLYTPILRSFPKATLGNSLIATVLAMGIAGLWHGPAWTFIMFGLLHGVGLAVHQFWKKRKLKMPDSAGWLLTCVFVNIGFVFFRSSGVPAALRMLRAMVPHSNLLEYHALARVLPMTPMIFLRPELPALVLAFWGLSSWDLAQRFRPTWFTACTTAALLLLGLILMNSSAAKPFLYFAF